MFLENTTTVNITKNLLFVVLNTPLESLSTTTVKTIKIIAAIFLFV